jgi:hypothetical protein
VRTRSQSQTLKGIQTTPPPQDPEIKNTINNPTLQMNHYRYTTVMALAIKICYSIREKSLTMLKTYHSSSIKY